MKKIAIAASLMLVFGAQEAIAQTAGANVSGTVEQSLYINLDQTAVTFADANAAAFNAGFSQITGGTLTHNGNVTHSVTVLADAVTMTGTGVGARADKPASDVELQVDAGAYAALSNSVAGSIATGAVAGEYTKALTYKMLLDWASDTPGVYDLDVTYTIAAD